VSWAILIAKVIAAFPELVKAFYEIRKQIEQEAVRRIHEHNARDVDKWVLDNSEPQSGSSTAIKGKDAGL
jgi:hypothetical protein